MTKAVLVRRSDNAVVGSVIDTARPQWIVDPETGGKLASPATIGWESDDYRLCPLAALSLPQSKAISGERRRADDAGTGAVVETAKVVDVPPPPTTDAERLERATGLTVSQIKAVLEEKDRAR